MKWDGPDSIKSWLISLSCCFINSITFGLSRLSGVLFVASITRYNVGREQASFPYTLASSVRSLVGPIAGFLGYKFGIGRITAFGALLGVFGIGLCYFAENITVVTVLWGVVFGIGFGFGNILLGVIINQYFEKYRATASGISLSGPCIGSFIFPPIVEVMLKNYGLSQTFLMLSTFLLLCIPVALLLKSPNFEIKSKNFHKENHEEKQNIVSGIRKSLYTEERNYEDLEKCNSIMSDISLNKEKYDKYTKGGGIKIMTNQTSFSGCSIYMSKSEPSDLDYIKGNIKEERKHNHNNLEGETVYFPSEINNKAHISHKDKDFDRVLKNRGMHYEEIKTSLKISSTFNDNHILNRKMLCETLKNYNFHPSANAIHENFSSSHKIHTESKTLNSPSESVVVQDSMSRCSEQEYTDIKMRSEEVIENSSHKMRNYSKSNIDECNKNEIMGDKSHIAETKNSSRLELTRVLFHPIFILVSVSDAIYGSAFTCIITIIVDFSRDLHIETSHEKYILMLLSVGDFIGTLGFGWITDHGYMTATTFAATSFAFQGLFSASIGFSNDFTSLATLVTMYGLTQAGLACIFPVIIAEHIDLNKQFIAIPSYHFLSSLVGLSIASLIGYFRDGVGAYNWIFYGIGILSAISSLLWIFATCILKRRNQN